MFLFLIINSLSLGLPNFRPITINETSEVVYDIQNTTFDLLPNTNFGSCMCDISSQCDPNCCCDPDCPANLVFDYCLPEVAAIDTNRLDSVFCNTSHMRTTGSFLEWFLRTSLCIYRVNNPSPGDFYDLTLTDTTVDLVPFESNPSTFYYTYSTTSPVTSGNPTPYTEFVGAVIPRAGPDGFCVLQNVRYLESVNEICMLDPNNSTNITCGTDQYFSSIVNISAGDTLTAADFNTLITAQCAADPAETSIQIQVRWGSETPLTTTSPNGYRFGEQVTDADGIPITIGSACNSSYTLLFGMNTDFECYVNSEPLDIIELNASDFTFDGTNFSISPFYNNLADNVGNITQQYSTEFVNLTSSTTDMLNIYYFSQTYNIIYKSIGLKRYPQHIISAFNVVNDVSVTDISYKQMLTQDIEETQPILKVSIRFYEEPNDDTLFSEVDKSHEQAWLPF